MPTLVDPKLFPRVKEPGKFFINQKEFVHEMLIEGKDPKDKLIEYCKPHCTHWKDKLSRCEKKLE